MRDLRGDNPDAADLSGLGANHQHVRLLLHRVRGGPLAVALHTGPKDGPMYRHSIAPTYFAVVAGLLFLSGSEPADAQQRAIPMREVAPPGHEPYSTNFSITITSGSGANGDWPDVVPANKRLVMEFVSVRVVLQPTESPRFALQDSIGTASRSYVLPLTLAGSFASGDEYRGAQQVKLYFDGNGTSGPAADCARAANSFNSMTCDITISGYLIDK